VSEHSTGARRRSLRAPWTRSWLRAGFWTALAIATYFAFAPYEAQPDLPVGSIATHGFAFIFLTVALRTAYFPVGHFWTVVALMAGYGLFIEVVQSFLAYRSSELKDLLIDGAGIAIGMLLYRWPVSQLVARWFR
jgi:hypothetical protein